MPREPEPVRLTDAGRGQERVRKFTFVLEDGSPANITGRKVICYKRPAKDTWRNAVSINTVSNPTELVITDAINGKIELRPLPSWWSVVGEFEIIFKVLKSGEIPYFAPDTGVHPITVVGRP